MLQTELCYLPQTWILSTLVWGLNFIFKNRANIWQTHEQTHTRTPHHTQMHARTHPFTLQIQWKPKESANTFTHANSDPDLTILFKLDKMYLLQHYRHIVGLKSTSNEISVIQQWSVTAHFWMYAKTSTTSSLQVTKNFPTNGGWTNPKNYNPVWSWDTQSFRALLQEVCDCVILHTYLTFQPMRLWKKEWE